MTNAKTCNGITFNQNEKCEKCGVVKPDCAVIEMEAGGSTADFTYCHACYKKATAKPKPTPQPKPKPQPKNHCKNW
jgi:hypothetical protein